MKASSWTAWLLSLACLGMAPLAQAQFAVIDVASVTQLIQQMQTLEQQLSTARSQLGQAQAEYQSITGNRGMQSLLPGIERNYLPTSLSGLQGTLGAGSPGALGSSVRSALAAGAVLSDAQLRTLSPQAQAQLVARRQDAALMSGVTQQALLNSSGRFEQLQQLIDTIGQASDQKAALDLQARISAEAGMLQNESTKLQVLFQTVRAQQAAAQQQQREQIVAGHGQFSGRFEPQP
ncbi:MAG TPA: type IV secretion system protein [Steroidobacteraceae bacterium]|nr:type IV secretion system protein [Steroidobacteraceae bacterium]